MKLSSNSINRHTKLVGVALICGLTAVGCSKKSDDEKKAAEDEVQVNNQTSESSEMSDTQSTSLVQCDDEAVLSQLNQSIQTSISLQSQNLFNNFASSANVKLSKTELGKALDSILIDVADATVLQEANADGMVTCKTSLSLTLPNKDVTRAMQVYETLEDGSLSDYLKNKNVTLNNNMLVSNNFNYVVGLQNNQPVARLVGVSNISTAAADILARSQFKAALDASRPSRPSRPAPVANKPRPEPRLPTPPAVRTEPKPRVEPPPDESNAYIDEIRPEITQPAKPNVDNVPNTAPSTKSDKTFEVPKDESIEMLIIEEEGTY